jgi:hypothetical protein
MRHGQALVLGLLIGLLAGCANDRPAGSSSWLDRWRPFRGPAAADVIEVRVALVERPPGDPFINQELWSLADEQIVPLEQKLALEENGFRVGQIGGNTPAGLLTLLTSGRSNVNPRGFFVHANQPITVVLGPRMPLCSFQIQHERESAEVSVDKAQCIFSLVPSLTSDGRTRLMLTPQVHHGEKKLIPRAAEDGSGFVLQEEWPTNSYSSLAWEVTLTAHQCLVVGGRSDRPETLGYRCFLRRDESVPVQRLLVIHSCRLKPPSAFDMLAESRDEAAAPSRAPPLALQAAWTKARGSAQ